MKIIVKMKFGSHLYGTDTPESDLDIKGVFLPKFNDILLGNISKSIVQNTKIESNVKNCPQDIDIELYSLHYFINLACQGETAALDMLHAPGNMLINSSHVWEEIVENRNKFYTKNLKAFVSYARKQAAKYGIKGSRLKDCRNVCSFLFGLKAFTLLNEDNINAFDAKLKDFWHVLPSGEHIFNNQTDKNGLRIYQVCGKQFQETAKVSYVYSVLKGFIDKYGHRAQLAEQNEGIDWKAVSHAFRAAFQVRSILTQGTIVFPLPEAEFLKKIKRGELNFLNELSPMLESLMDEIEELSKESTLPEEVDKLYWDNFIVRTVLKELFV